MSEAQNSKPQQILDWDKMVEMSNRAKEQAKEQGCTFVMMCGLGIWSAIRNLAESRLREPLVGDILVIDGVEWQLSMNVGQAQVMAVDSEEIRVEIPLVLQPTANDGLETPDPYASDGGGEVVLP